MNFRINITNETIWRAIAKAVLQKGEMDVRLELDTGTGEWFVAKSGWKPLNDFKADNPATLLRAIAAVLDHHTGEDIPHTTSENPTDGTRLLE